MNIIIPSHDEIKEIKRKLEEKKEWTPEDEQEYHNLGITGHGEHMINKKLNNIVNNNKITEKPTNNIEISLNNYANNILFLASALNNQYFYNELQLEESLTGEALLEDLEYYEKLLKPDLINSLNIRLEELEVKLSHRNPIFVTVAMDNFVRSIIQLIQEEQIIDFAHLIKEIEEKEIYINPELEEKPIK